MNKVRAIGAALIAAAAIGIFFGMAPADPDLDPQAFGSAITTALDEADANETFAQGAPQQQVVNGWVARDLLSIVASQNDEVLQLLAVPTPTDDRPAALLALAVVAICLFGATSPRPAVPDVTPQPAAAWTGPSNDGMSASGDLSPAPVTADPGSVQGPGDDASASGQDGTDPTTGGPSWSTGP